MNPIQALLLKWGAKLMEALYKKQYEVSKEKLDAKVNTDKPDKPDDRRVRKSS